MKTSKLGFSPKELNSSFGISAAVVAWHLPGSRKLVKGSLPWGTYAVVWAGGGKEGVLWGAAYADTQAPLLALGIQRLLSVVPKGMEVYVQALHELGANIGPDGHVRKAEQRNGRNSKGKPFDGYRILLDIAKRMDAGEWTCQPVGRPPKEGRLAEAKERAEGRARTDAMKYQAERTPSFPTEGLASATIINCPDPVPYAVFLEGEA